MFIFSGAPFWLEEKTLLENKLYRNDGNKWIDVKDAGVGDRGYGWGACGDYDNDGAIDLYVTNFGKDTFYRNNSDGTFTDITDDRYRQPAYGDECSVVIVIMMDDLTYTLQTMLNILSKIIQVH